MSTLVSNTPKCEDTKLNFIHSSTKSSSTYEGLEACEMSYNYYFLHLSLSEIFSCWTTENLYRKETGGRREEKWQIKT